MGNVCVIVIKRKQPKERGGGGFKLLNFTKYLIEIDVRILITFH